MTHYKTTDQITETCNYKFELPKYPKSTTDPTFYEPAATRIANMRKSASAGKSLYDFEYDPDSKKFKNMNEFQKEEYFLNLHDSMRITPGRKPGLTQEEISQNLNNTISDVEEIKESKQKEKEEKEKQIRDTKELLNGISAINDSETSNE